MNKVSVVVISPNQFFREGARQLLRDSPYDVVAELATAAEVVSTSHGSAVDMLIWGPGTTDNVEAEAAELRRQLASERSRMVVFMDIDDVQAVRRVATLGVDAILSYSISAELFPRVIDVVLLGQQVFPATAVRMAGSPSMNGLVAEDRVNASAGLADAGDNIGLTEREAQILTHIVNGASNKSIGRQLSLTEPAIKAHVKAMFRKIGVNNRTQAAVWATNLNRPDTSPSQKSMGSKTLDISGR